MFWDLYTLFNEQQVTIAEVWDGSDLKFTIRRTVTPGLFNRWLELVALIETIQLSGCEDHPLWMFHPTEVCSTKCFYGIVIVEG